MGVIEQDPPSGGSPFMIGLSLSQFHSARLCVHFPKLCYKLLSVIRLLARTENTEFMARLGTFPHNCREQAIKLPVALVFEYFLNRTTVGFCWWRAEFDPRSFDLGTILNKGL